MTETLKRILKEFEELKGQIIIDAGSYKLKRLIAILEDPDDWYYVLWNGEKLSFASCLIGITPLKGFIKDKDYDRYKYWASINNLDQETCFGYEDDENKAELVAAVRKEVEDYCKNSIDKFITEVCWDIN